MILQALHDYYHRKAADPRGNIAPLGWEWKEIPFLIVIDEKGEFCHIEDTREEVDKKLVPREFLVPQGKSRSSGIAPYLLWDNIEYVLGANPRERKDIPERHNSFKKRIYQELGEYVKSPPVSSVLAFLENDPMRQIEQNSSSVEIWQEVFEKNASVAFRIAGSPYTTVFEPLKPIMDFFSPEGEEGVCLITGEKAPIARIHSLLKGVRGAKTTGASIASVNAKSFESYGKEQYHNSPVSEKAAFYYTTALNVLLAKDSQNKLYFGADTLVFWAQKPSVEGFNMEEVLPGFVMDPPKDAPDKGVESIRALYGAVKTGNLPAGQEDAFYLLGFAPNSARLAVRFWRSGTVADFGRRIMQHFQDVQICHGPKEPEFVTLHQMLRATAFEFKSSNVVPHLGAAFITAVLDGTPYPVTLFQQCMRRVRAERHINRARAGIIKGYLNRRPQGLDKEVITVALDTSNTNTGYRLGRLFATLEKIQEEAQGSINATIKDRYYGAASSTPITVFSQLLKLKNHHLKKMENRGAVINHENQLGEILSEISEFPSHLTMEDQGFFAIGYYHQRQYFFTKKEDHAPKGVTKQ